VKDRIGRKIARSIRRGRNREERRRGGGKGT
jgi:hypothetical protein